MGSDHIYRTLKSMPNPATHYIFNSYPCSISLGLRPVSQQTIAFSNLLAIAYPTGSATSEHLAPYTPVQLGQSVAVQLA